MPSTVYISDTSSDLQALRPILIQQVEQMGMRPVWLDDRDRRAPNMEDILRRKIETADYFLAVIAFKRGWQPETMGGKALAEIECDLAHDLGKPSVIFLPQPESDLAEQLRYKALGQDERERAAQLALWRHLVELGSVSFFTDEADLTRQVRQTLRQWSTGTQAALPAAPTPERAQRFFAEGGLDNADVEYLADRVAEKTAARMQEIQQDQQEELAKQTLKVNEALRLWPGELVFGRPLERRQFQSDIFMIMPFAREFSDIYAKIIRPLVADLNLSILRGDEFSSARGSIMEEVWAALNACRFVIAEITGGNDNVFYELGIAHTLNKPAILITQARRPEQVPFDVRHLRYITYDNTAAGSTKLESDLRTAITRLLADLQEGAEQIGLPPS